MIGDSSEKTAEKLIPIVNKINSLEDEIRGLADTELFAKTEQFKERLGSGETLDDLLVELFVEDLRAVGIGLGIREARLQKLTKLQVLREIGQFVEKKCSDSVQAGLTLLPPLLNDVRDRLKMVQEKKD